MPAPPAALRVASPRRLTRLVPFLMIALLTAAALLASLWLAATPSWAGEHGSKSRSYSSSSSGDKTVRSETYSKKKSSTHHSIRSDTGEYDGPAEIDAYVFSRDDRNWRHGSGTDRDWREAEALRDELGDLPMLWFRRSEERYVITDARTLERMAEVMAPQEELGRRQGELGRRQGDLGRMQGDLGRRQGKLGRMQADVARLQARITTRIALANGRDLDTDDLERDREELARRQEEIGRLQSEVGEYQSQLGKRQAALGEQQAALGREQDRMAKIVQREMTGIVRDAIERGIARRVD